jgi:hypothetical protein
LPENGQPKKKKKKRRRKKKKGYLHNARYFVIQ